jgi:hypothetical protein
VTDKQFTAILSPVQKLSNLSASVEEKVTMLYEISVESIRYNENQASELKTQTSILKDIRNLLSGGASGSKSKAKKEKEVKGPKPSSFAGLDKLNKDTIGIAALAMVGIAAAIVAAAGIFTFIPIVKGAQLLTALAISVAFIPMSYAFVQIASVLSKVKGGDNIKDAKGVGLNGQGAFMLMGSSLLAMVGMSAAVTLSSKIMQYIVPVKMEQIGTAFFIGLAMVGMAYGYAEVVRALARVKEKKTGKINTKDLFSMIGGALLSMIGMAGAIALSSKIMQYIVPVSMDKLGTAFAISVVMIGAAFAYSLIAKNTKKLKFKDILMATAAIPLIAIGLTAAAWIFTFLPETFNAPPWKWSLKSGLALAVFGLSFVILAKTVGKLPIKDLLFGVIGMAAVAVGILAVAWIFSILPDTFTEVPMGWVLGSVVALVGFGVVVGIIGAIIMATGGTGLAAIALGVVGMIIIAAGILAVAWILSYIPAGKLAQVAAGLTDALLAPVNGIVDVLARLKNEIGVENLVPLAGGILAVSGSLIALAAAVAGVAVAGLGASLANAASSFVDWVAGNEKEGPMQILEKLVGMHSTVQKTANAMKPLSESFKSLINLATADNINKLRDLSLAPLLLQNPMYQATGMRMDQYFTEYPKFLNKVADGFVAIKTAQSGMDMQIIDKTTEMIKALAYLNEFGGDNAMEKLGKSLVNAVQELSDMISKFGGSVDAQTENGAKSSGALEKATGAISSFVSKFTGGGSGGSSSTPQISNTDMSEVVDAIEELQRIVKMNKGFA